jgi:hypothetical protein
MFALDAPRLVRVSVPGAFDSTAAFKAARVALAGRGATVRSDVSAKRDASGTFVVTLIVIGGVS